MIRYFDSSTIIFVTLSPASYYAPLKMSPRIVFRHPFRLLSQNKTFPVRVQDLFRLLLIFHRKLQTYALWCEFPHLFF